MNRDVFDRLVRRGWLCLIFKGRRLVYTVKKEIEFSFPKYLLEFHLSLF